MGLPKMASKAGKQKKIQSCFRLAHPRAGQGGGIQTPKCLFKELSWCEVADTPEEGFGPGLSAQDGDKGKETPKGLQGPSWGIWANATTEPASLWSPLLVTDPSQTRALGSSKRLAVC